MHGAGTCAGYMEREVFGFLLVEPFSLTQGDVARNLEQLRSRGLDEVQDETTAKIRRLQSIGFEDDVLQAGVELLRETPCTVNVVEQAHGSAATIARAHVCAYSEPSLVHRGGLHKLRALFFSRCRAGGHPASARWHCEVGHAQSEQGRCEADVLCFVGQGGCC